MQASGHRALFLLRLAALQLRHLRGFTRPTLVYQMGKVGSYSLYQSLRAVPGLDAFHVHRLHPDNIARVRAAHLRAGQTPVDDSLGYFLYQRLICAPRQPINVISLVRDPISRNFSAYFENLARLERREDAHNKIDIPTLISNFFDKYRHETPLQWFDKEIKCTLGIDVFAHDFLPQQGWCEINQGPVRLLILRCELSNAEKQAQVKRFLDLEHFEIVNRNVGSSKPYASAYEDLA
tara:strand:+ start:148 stop:855 length:708 start_codon:yes stop_codon:yes gene_type:complete